MAKIRVDLDSSLYQGRDVAFRAPADCSNVTGLIVYYPNGTKKASKTFEFADAHGNNVGSIDLFAANALVKVILDTELNRAYVQNADTNAYLEAQLASKASSEEVANIKVGGRNYIPNSGVATVCGSYSSYVPTSPLVSGEQYTISICCTPASGLESFDIFLSNGNRGLGSLTVNGTGKQVVSRVFTASYTSNLTPENGYKELRLYPTPRSASGSTIHWIKVEMGNKATDWTPAPEDTAPASHSHTASQVGAAPAGYGLGASCVALPTWEDATKNGFYTSTGGLPSGFVGDTFQGFAIDNNKFVMLNIWQTGNGLDNVHLFRKYSNISKTWGEWEFVNPPMKANVEYRTTERIEGKAVYKKKDSSGAILYRLDGETEWKKQNELMGAAPTGYGLGATICPVVTNFNAAKATGFYSFGYQAENRPGSILEGTIVVTTRYNAVIQKVYGTHDSNEQYNTINAQRRSTDGGNTWGAWEYENPPMVVDNAEYRTTERYMGKPVYTKLISFDEVPGESIHHFDISLGSGALIRSSARIHDPAGAVSVELPFNNGEYKFDYSIGMVSGSEGDYRAYVSNPLDIPLPLQIQVWYYK